LIQKPLLLARVAAVTFLLVVLLLAAVFSQPKSRPGSANQSTLVSPTLVFAITGEPNEYQMDAVTIFSGRQFMPPYAEEQKDAQKKFGDKYFATDRKYRMIFGGGAAGTVTVTKWSEGCNNIHSEVSTVTSARLGGQVRALATNDGTLGTRESSRRAPSDNERTAVLALVKSIYSQRRTPSNQIGSIKVTNLTATDLDGDGRQEMIGSFALTSKNKFQRDLFLIAKSAGTAMRADFVKFQAYQPPPEGFLSSIDFIDQLDVHKNGTGEVFAVQGGFDGYAYLVFRKVAGQWRQVFQGMGDAC